MTVLELPPTTESVPVARRFLRAVLQQVGEDVDVDTAVLLGSELVTNAVLHARTSVTLMVEVRGVVVRVAVRDESPVAPRVHAFSSSAATGRGLRLIEAMAERWGTDAADGGKVVWVEVGPVSESDWPAFGGDWLSDGTAGER